MKQFRLTLDTFNREFETIFFFPILRDDYIYLYYTYETQSILYGRFRFAYANNTEWEFYEFDYDADEYKLSLLTSDGHTLEDVLRSGYDGVVNNKEKYESV
jgi:hypothetical protein